MNFSGVISWHQLCRGPPAADRADPDRDQAVTGQARQRMEARREAASTEERPRSWWRRFWNGD